MAAAHKTAQAVTLAVTTLIILISTQTQEAAAQCEGQLGNVVNHCFPYITYDADPIAVPSYQCCRAFGPLDLVCACNYLLKYPKSYGNVSRKFFVYAAVDCAHAPRHGNYCGIKYLH
uniref:Bifunctional inhibitor/plant lipid transfer protein/seed storage helical domain-containing protein n=1 Tax=Kalanchoe fedtschenkoi TaxID=63787 RepID=A0A7N0U3Z2_KALFE